MVLRHNISKPGLLAILLCMSQILPANEPDSMCQPHKQAVREVLKYFGDGTVFSEMEITSVHDSALKYLHANDCIHTIRQAGESRGYMISTRAMGRFEFFDYVVVFTDRLMIQDVLITAYRSSHGTGICNKKWLRQFRGYQGGKLELGPDIDAVSGGTISAKALVDDVQRCALLISFLLQDQ